MNREVLIFGAGAVGRGFIAEIFHDAGWDITFVDADGHRVDDLRKGYDHATVWNGKVTTKRINPTSVLHTSEHAAVTAAVSRCHAIFTSVGVAHMEAVASSLGPGLTQRLATGNKVDLYLAENAPDVAQQMRSHLERVLGRPTHWQDQFGVVALSVGRMIPSEQTAAHAPGFVAVEPYRQLPFDVRACRAAVPDVPDMVSRPEISFDYFVQRKLFVHNFGHACVGYLGRELGYDFITDAMHDRVVEARVKNWMAVTARSLATRWGTSPTEELEHAHDLLVRFSNRDLNDTVTRVGRDPRRKLSPRDRFLGALELTARASGLQEARQLVPAVAVAALASRHYPGGENLVPWVHEQLTGVASELGDEFRSLVHAIETSGARAVFS